MRFFFYGTLIAESGNPVATAIHAKLRPLGPATVRGRLYAVPDALGWYPALLPGSASVSGWLYETSERFGRHDLARLDAYEDYDPSRPRLSLYLRQTVDVRTERDAALSAQAYRFNRPLPPGSRRISDGNFRNWLARSGRNPFTGSRSFPPLAFFPASP